MALCIGFEGVGLMAYSPSRSSVMSSGKSQVYRKQVSAKRWSRDRARRRFPIFCFDAPSNWYCLAGECDYSRGRTYLLIVSCFNWAYFIHCRHRRRAGITPDIDAQGRASPRSYHGDCIEPNLSCPRDEDELTCSKRYSQRREGKAMTRQRWENEKIPTSKKRTPH